MEALGPGGDVVAEVAGGGARRMARGDRVGAGGSVAGVHDQRRWKSPRCRTRAPVRASRVRREELVTTSQRIRAPVTEYLNIVEESEDWLVVDKPGDLVCHPTVEGPTSSLIGRLRLYFEGQIEVSPHFVNRLDRETSGLVLISKRATGHKALCRAYEQAEKTYWAVVEGWPPADSGCVDAPLARSQNSLVRLKQAVAATGAWAVTEWRVLKRWERSGRCYSLLEVRPRTGRLHQIRVHLSWLGHPLVGDKIYGSDESFFVEFLEHGWTQRLEQGLESRRHLLSALKLRVGTHQWQASPPDDLLEFLGG